MDRPRRALVRILGPGIGEPLSDAAHVSAFAVDRLLERARPTFGRDEMIEVFAAETSRGGEVAGRGLRPIRLAEPPAGGVDLRELWARAVRQHDGPYELAHQLLHRL